jgi:hypothetical protein
MMMRELKHAEQSVFVCVCGGGSSRRAAKKLIFFVLVVYVMLCCLRYTNHQKSQTPSKYEI